MEAVSSRRTLFSSTRPSHTSQDSAVEICNPKSLHTNANEERPHSKTPVLGKQIKTRLTCNHMKPKCEACVANKKKSLRHKHHKSLFFDTPKQSHILPSTRSIPRGSTDGRKLYEQEHFPQKSLSVVDASWKPGRDIYAENQIKKDDNEFSSSRNGLTKISLKEGAKKKVQFIDKDGNTKKKTVHHHKVNIDDHKHKADNEIENSRHKENSSLPHKENGKKNLEQDTYSMENYDNGKFHSHVREPYFSDKDEMYISNSTSDQDLSEQRYKNVTCKLCESQNYHCTKHKTVNRHAFSRHRRPLGRRRTYSQPMPSSTEDDDHCLLCQRYGKDHYYVDDSDCCHLCELPFERQQMKSDRLFSSPFHRRRVPPPPVPEHVLPRFPLCRRHLSAPMFFSDGEEDSAFKKIPYEPKTEMVKDLKKKIEDEYLPREYLKKKKVQRPWRSWDAEDLEELRNFRRHRCDDPWKYVPQHKCIHRYLQNNRLFLEPTLTNEDGSSVCSECGAPQPEDLESDPYLYHITLGGLHTQDKYEKENTRRKHHENLSGIPARKCSGNLSYKSKSQGPPHQMGKSVKRLPGDTSKHLFAKLNHNVDNMFPANSHYHFRPHLANHLRYKVSPFTKRHPSKSMALVDHLL